MDDSDTIDKKEFHKAMKSKGITLESSDVDNIFNRYDVNGDGILNYSEFMDLLGFKLSEKIKH